MEILHDRGLPTTVGDEGGFAPPLPTNDAAIELILEAIEKAGHRPGEDIAIALDPATSELEKDGRYVLAREGRTLRAGGACGPVGRTGAGSTRSSRSRTGWRRRTGTGWRSLTERLGSKVQLVGDDIFVTNVERIRRGIRGEGGELGADQAQPDRDADGDAGRRSRRREARGGRA